MSFRKEESPILVIYIFLDVSDMCTIMVRKIWVSLTLKLMLEYSLVIPIGVKLIESSTLELVLLKNLFMLFSVSQSLIKSWMKRKKTFSKINSFHKLLLPFLETLKMFLKLILKTLVKILINLNLKFGSSLRIIL